MERVSGRFEATLANLIEHETDNYVTDVEYNLCPNGDKIICKFTTLKGDSYTFDIDLYFEYYYTLLYKRFGSETTLFGTITKTFNGYTSSITKTRSRENVINALVYALKEIFICIKQIIEIHKEKTLAYCFLHDEDPCKVFTYEEYIHSVACSLIIKSGYYKDTLSPLFNEDPVEFINEPREFCAFLLEN